MLANYSHHPHQNPIFGLKTLYDFFQMKKHEPLVIVIFSMKWFEIKR